MPTETRSTGVAPEQEEGSVLLVTPTYNERGNLQELAARVFTAVPARHPLLVGDDPPDGTADLCGELQRQYPGLRLLRRTGARGLGRAYLAGLRYGLERRYAVIGTLGADPSHNPHPLKALAPPAPTPDGGGGAPSPPG